MPQPMTEDTRQPPTSFRITGLPDPERWVVDGADAAWVNRQVVGPDLELHLPARELQLVVRPVGG